MCTCTAGSVWLVRHRRVKQLFTQCWLSEPYLLNKHKLSVFNSHYCQNLLVEGIFKKPQEENIVETWIWSPEEEDE